MNNDSTHLKKEILIRLVKAFFSDNFENKTRLIPFDMRPKGADVPYRCCIYKERAILKDRVIAGLGFAIEDDDETVSLTEYAHNSLKRKQPENNPLTVLGAACKACVPKRIHVTDLCQGCVARPCKSTFKFNAIDIVDGKSVIDSKKCKACKMCISACPYSAIVKVAVPCEDNCPVNAIEKNEDGTAKIDFDKCIFCGKCVTKCPFGAVHEKSQLIEVLKLLKDKKKTSIMIAPAVAGQFPGTIGQLKSALKKIGFSYIYEVAQGADITIKNEAKEFKEKMSNGQEFMTTSCCAGYNEFVKKHLQDMEFFKSETGTPLFYTAQIAKKEHKNVKTIFVSPCVAKKQEAQENKNVDYVINVEELGAILLALHIEIMDQKDMNDNNEPSKQGRNFCISGGVAESVKFCSDCTVNPKIINGINKENIKLLEKYSNDEICKDGNLICCEGGCIKGNAVITDEKISKKILDKIIDTSKDIKKK